MRISVGAALMAAAFGAVSLATADARACGGYFSGMQTTSAAGHRMIFSVSPTKTTLWDQIVYSGTPSSFAWVLPTKGIVEVGLSSEVLFEKLDKQTAVTLESPMVFCAPPCNASASVGGSGGGETVTL